MKPHKHAELIKAWADGAEIQWKNKVDGYWEECYFTPYWKDDCEYRLKPTLKELCVLTDDEINKLWAESSEDGIAMQQGFTTQQHYFAHLILKKASEK
jgi:hypothetical protein